MMSSLMPSEKYSCSGSPLMLLNARTAMERYVDGAVCSNGFSRSEAMGFLSAAAPTWSE